MGTTMDKSAMNKALKITYKDTLDRVVPSFNKCVKDIKFNRAKRNGKKYVKSIKLRIGHSHDRWSDGSMHTLTDPIAPVYEDAEIDHIEYLSRRWMSYDAAARAMTSKQAFYENTKEPLMDMVHEVGFNLELDLLYGKTSIGETKSVTYSSGTTGSLVITKASWAPGVWTQLEGGKIDVYDDADLSSEVATDITVTSVDPSTRTLQLSGTATDLGALTTSGGEHLVPANWKTNSMTGIRHVIDTPSSLYGITTSSYALFQANESDLSSNPLTFGKLMAALSGTVAKGLEGDTVVYLSPFTWTDINVDHAPLVQLSQREQKKLDIGSESIKFTGVTGSTEFKVHPMVKAGEALVLTTENWERIGTTEPTNTPPGSPDGEMVFHSPTKAGWEFRRYYAQNVICHAPAKQLLIKGILNNSL